MRIIKYFIVACVTISASLTLAQNPANLSASDLNSVNIDALSDAQIQQFLDRATESGLTLDQLELVAKQRGMSNTQLAKLRNRIRQLQVASREDQSIPSTTTRLRESQADDEDEFEFFSFLSPSDTSTVKGLKIFGLELFNRNDITFEPSLNVATPANYVLGPGDEVIIDVYGASEITYQETISPDGKIVISGLGPISLGGISVEVARKRLFSQLSKIYYGMRGRNPNTYFDFSLGQVRTIKVNVVGQVIQPGSYTLSSFSTVFNALYFAGGPNANGSLRSIDVIRNGEIITTFDAYAYLFLETDDSNITLKDQDIIRINPYVNRVKIAGNVKNKAIYELQEGETFEDLLTMAGGFSEKAFKDYVTIDRVGALEKEVRTIKQPKFAEETLQNGDSIYVGAVIDRYTNRVKIDGAVFRPGFYELSPKLTLAMLIEQAGGLREDAYLQRGNIIRLDDDLTLQNITFDVDELVNGNQDLLLSAEDYVRINSIFELEEEKIISIQGQVRIPGDYPFIAGMTVEDLLSLSGGLLEDASTSFVEVARRVTGNDLSKSSEIYTFSINGDLSVNEQASDFELEAFDLVLVKSTSFQRRHKVVKIEGEVNFPGFYALETNDDKISDLIKRAGGLTEHGYAEGASLIRRTEYFRNSLEREELTALIKRRRNELEKKYLSNGASSLESFGFIERQLVAYEKELTEAFKIEDSGAELEARIFRAQQLRKLLVRDSISGSEELIERQAIGIELPKVLTSPGSECDLILKDGDLISVPKQLETVRVQGEVLYPNTVRFNKGMSFKKYVSASGGFSNRAKVNKSYVVYSNGSAKRTSSFLFLKKFPPVKPGADIIIPRKPDRRQLSTGEVLGITSGLASLSLVILQIINITN